MKKLFAIILLSIPFLTNAQNYNPFLKGKIYQYLNTSDSSIYIQKFDSISVLSKDDTISYSSIHLANQGLNIDLDVCNSNIHIISSKIRKHKNELLFSAFNYNDIDKFDLKIKTDAKINESWLCQSYMSYSGITAKKYLKYLGKEHYTSNEITDTVKVYQLSIDSVFTNIVGKIYLSKNYGFINGLIGYNNLYSIIGLNIGSQKLVNFSGNIGDTIVLGHETPQYMGDYNYLEQTLIIVKDSNNPIFFNKYFVKIKIKSNVYFLEETSNDYTGISNSSYSNKGYKEKYGQISKGGGSYGRGGWVNWSDNVLYYKGKNGEFGKRSYLTKLTSGIEDEDFNKIKIYPNPSKGSVQIEFPNNIVDINLSVYNLQGIKIEDIKTNDSLINLNLKPGVYFIKSTLNNKIDLQKIVIE